MQKQVLFKTKGMQRDLAASAFNPEYAYDNKNIRIMPTDENTLFSILNEKGNLYSDISGVDNIVGIPVGQCIINDDLILFISGHKTDLNINDIIASTEDIQDIHTDGRYADIDIDNHSDDSIYKLWFSNNKLTGQRLYNGQLGFDYKHPIEALAFYENADIRKIYWTDGLNQPRVINVKAGENLVKKWSNTSFDFVRKLQLKEAVDIRRIITANGSFSPGVIQYAFTYFDKYGQESNIFYTSPLYYVSYNNRGAGPEDKVSNSFYISIDYVDSSFDYLRIYSIHRTSIDATPTVKRVADLQVPTEGGFYSMNRWESKYITPDDVLLRDVMIGKLIPLSSIEPTTSTDFYNQWAISSAAYTRLIINDDYVNIPSKGIKITMSSTSGMQIQNTDGSSMSVFLHSRNKLEYTDNGTQGDIADPTELLYLGGEEVIFGTMSQKDNTLFLGDITLSRKLIDKSIRDFFRGGNIEFSIDYKDIKAPNPTGFYPYDNHLDLNSYQIKTFKYLETYRFGLQFQHITGRWSEPIWVNDAKNILHVICKYTDNTSIKLPTASYYLNNKDIIGKLIAMGYVKVRPVIVYPTIGDRECICDGILCPTVFNVGDRAGNSPFAQSSWFTRANAPFNVEVAEQSDWASRRTALGPSIDSRTGVMSNYRVKVNDIWMEEPNRGAWAEFRHNRAIPNNVMQNAEIQCIHLAPNQPNIPDNYTESDLRTYIAQNAENFYIDQSILTFHSPDIEFDDAVKSIDTSNLQLRIIGLVPLTSFIGDIDIQTSTPPNVFRNTQEVTRGFYKESISSENISRFGWRGLMAGGFWFDDLSNYTADGNPNKLSTGFVVYPFHRNGSLNNQREPSNGYTSAMLSRKKISNLRYSYNTYFLDIERVVSFYVKDSPTKTGISGISIFDSNEVSLIKVPAPANSGLNDISYYGNVDKVLTISRSGDKKDGYPIVITGIQNADVNSHGLFANPFFKLDTTYTDKVTGIDPVRMRYKSTPHAVLALNYTSKHEQWILPTMKDGKIGYGEAPDTWDLNLVQQFAASTHAFWDKDKTCLQVLQDTVDLNMYGVNDSLNGYGPEFGWLWLGQIYNPDVVNRFGGQTEEAFENNQWLPCGDSVSLMNGPVTVRWTEGDTYYQRYDHIKTYPFSLEEQNGITDIVSFMCETRVNLDGRYDKNRGQVSNFAITPENFNKINNVYSQYNNFFNYRSVNPNKLNLDNFHNSITWTKTKTAGELTDTWTNITLASTLDLDGDKGSIRALRRFNNSLLAFQDKGISQILYNENMQFTSTQGVPIEIGNSGKVNGKRYLTDKIGCSNKWSICETSNGIYFIDDITKGIFLFNGKLDNLSDRLGFHSWINARSTGVNIWNPVDFEGFVTYYDKVNGDVFFISRDECLAFSEPIAQFSSFYSYECMPYFSNLEDRGIGLKMNEKTCNVWLHNEGDYNMFFGKYQPFYTTVIANSDMTSDKIFNTVEFRSDTWSKDKLLNATFDTLTTWNEYQKGTVSLNNVYGRPSELKRKFRIWRANIPRDIANGRDRMRNPWLYIKLSMEHENINKTILHDMVVYYFD